MLSCFWLRQSSNGNERERARARRCVGKGRGVCMCVEERTHGRKRTGESERKRGKPVRQRVCATESMPKDTYLNQSNIHMYRYTYQHTQILYVHRQPYYVCVYTYIFIYIYIHKCMYMY